MSDSTKIRGTSTRTLTKKQWRKIPAWRKIRKNNKNFALFQIRKGTSSTDLQARLAEVKIISPKKKQLRDIT